MKLDQRIARQHDGHGHAATDDENLPHSERQCHALHRGPRGRSQPAHERGDDRSYERYGQDDANSSQLCRKERDRHVDSFPVQLTVVV